MIIHNPVISGSLTFAPNATFTSDNISVTGSFTGEVFATNGIISSSDQVNADTIIQFDANVEDAINAIGVLSGSQQVIAENTDGFTTSVTNIINNYNVLSGSDQLTSSFDNRYVNSTGNESIGGNKTFTDTVTIVGNLIVDGTTTTTSTNNVIIGDNTVELNYGGGATDGGIYITDVTGGGLETGSLLWSGDDDRWKAGPINNEKNILLADGDSVVSSSAQISNYGVFAELNGNSLVSGSSQINANETNDWSADFKTELNSNTVISGSSQLTDVFLSKEGDGVISSSAQITITESQITDLSHYTDSDVKTKLDAEGVISGSSQISLTGFDTDDVNEGSINLYYTDGRVKDKLNADNVISQSNQVDGTSILNNTISIDGNPTALGGSISTITILEGSGVHSGSAQVANSLLNQATDFGTGRVSADSIGNVDGSSTITGSFVGDGTNLSGVTSYTDSDTLDYINSLNVVSSSVQIDVTATTNYSSINQYSDSKVKDKLNADNVISGSSQVALSTTDVSEGTNLYYTDVRVKDKLNTEGVISSSAQLAADFLDTFGENVVSSSAQISNYGVFAELNGDGLISSSAQLTDIFLSKDGNGVVSGSLQIDVEQTTNFSTFSSSVDLRLDNAESANSSGNDRLNSLEGFTSSIDTTIKTKLNTDGVISGSAQLTNIFLEINGDNVISGSDQVVSSLVSSNNISSGDKSTIQLNLGVDPAGSDNSTDVTLAGSYDYLTISGQVITRNQIDASTDISNLNTNNVSEAGNLYYTDGRVKAKLNSETVLSGSIVDILPSGVVSGSTQLYSDLDLRYGNELGDGLVSSSAQISGYDVFLEKNGDGVVSGSSQVTLSGDITGTANNTAIGTGVIVNADVNASAGIVHTKLNLNGSSIVSGSSQINHDSTTGFVPNEHIDHTTVSITAGSGLTGGGTIAATRTLNVGQGDGITVSADAIAVDATVLRTTGDGVVSGSVQVDHDLTTNFVENEHINHANVSITAGSGLTGGGTIAATRTINVGQGDGISVAADAVAVDSTVVRTTGNQTIGGVKTFNDIVVNGTGSFAYITSVSGTAKIIGDSFIVLNNDTPTERYAGLSVYDSGSAGVTASLQFDGQLNDWFYEYSDDGGVTTDHGVVMFGPEYATKGSPTYNTINTVLKSNGGHHTLDSNITDNGTTITLGSNTNISGTLTATTYVGQSSITTLGTISTGTWNGSVIASAYLDADTAHLSGTQTFSGAKTFSAAVSITDSTASTSKTTGALKVTGGVGVSGALNVGGDVVAYASSDKRLKDNIQNIENPIEKVQKLNGVTWDWNGNADELQQSLPNVGVIAQEVEEVFPQLVHDRDNGYKGVDYAKLTGLLIEAIKEQQKQIDELKSKLS